VDTTTLICHLSVFAIAALANSIMCGQRMVLAARLLASVFGAAVLVAAPAPAVAQIDSLPTLRVRAPATLAAAATRLELTPTAPLGTAMTLAGLREPGLPIDVILSPEDSDLARGTAPWISGFANAAQSRVVLFPARVGAFPAQSIETLLQHEVAHILFARAAGGHPVPRWFNEGLALAAERPIGLSDPPRLAWTLVRHGKLSLFALERLFGDGRAANQRAYAVAGALVQDLLRIHGDDSAARVLALIGEGRAFEDAFSAATGEPLAAAVDRFWSRQHLWRRWVPFLTGPAFLWSAITLLALFAIAAHRRRRAAQRRAWDAEEEAEIARVATARLLESDPDASGSSYDVH
jgi:hypothetical protein